MRGTAISLYIFREARHRRHLAPRVRSEARERLQPKLRGDAVAVGGGVVAVRGRGEEAGGRERAALLATSAKTNGCVVTTSSVCCDDFEEPHQKPPKAPSTAPSQPKAQQLPQKQPVAVEGGTPRALVVCATASSYPHHRSASRWFVDGRLPSDLRPELEEERLPPPLLPRERGRDVVGAPARREVEARVVAERAAEGAPVARVAVRERQRGEPREARSRDERRETRDEIEIETRGDVHTRGAWMTRRIRLPSLTQ